MIGTKRKCRKNSEYTNTLLHKNIKNFHTNENGSDMKKGEMGGISLKRMRRKRNTKKGKKVRNIIQ